MEGRSGVRAHASETGRLGSNPSGVAPKILKIALEVSATTCRTGEKESFTRGTVIWPDASDVAFTTQVAA